MAFRTWARLLAVTLGVGALAAASQLGVAYGLGVLRLTRVLDITTRDQWTAQLAWVAWLAAMSAVAAAVAGNRIRAKWKMPSTVGTRLGIALAAATGAAVTVPLTMQPARTAQIAGVHPVIVIGICAALGALVGLVAAYAALAQLVARWSLAALGAAVWLLAIVSVVPSLAPSDPLPSVRLGVFDAGFLAPAVTQRTALFTMPALALLIGAALGWAARRREMPTLTIALAGLAGPAVLTLSYLIAGPGSGSERYQVVPYWAAMTATGAGVLGSVLAAVIRRGGEGGPDPDDDAGEKTAELAIPGAAGAASPASPSAASPGAASPASPGAASPTSPGAASPGVASPTSPGDGLSAGPSAPPSGGPSLGRASSGSGAGTSPTGGPSLGGAPSGSGAGTSPTRGSSSRGPAGGGRARGGAGKPADTGVFDLPQHSSGGGLGSPDAGHIPDQRPGGRPRHGDLGAPAFGLGAPGSGLGAPGSGLGGPAPSGRRSSAVDAFTGRSGEWPVRATARPESPAGANARPETSVGANARPETSPPWSGARAAAAPEPAPYVPEPATRPLPPEAIQAPTTPPSRGRGRLPFGRRGRAAREDAPTPAGVPAPPHRPDVPGNGNGSSSSGLGHAEAEAGRRPGTDHLTPAWLPPAEPGHSPAGDLRTPAGLDDPGRDSAGRGSRGRGAAGRGAPGRGQTVPDGPARSSTGLDAPGRGPATRAPLVPEPHAISAPLPEPEPITPPLPVKPAPEPTGRRAKDTGGKGPKRKKKDDDFVDWVSGLGGE